MWKEWERDASNEWDRLPFYDQRDIDAGVAEDCRKPKVHGLQSSPPTYTISLGPIMRNIHSEWNFAHASNDKKSVRMVLYVSDIVEEVNKIELHADTVQTGSYTFECRDFIQSVWEMYIVSRRNFIFQSNYPNATNHIAWWILYFGRSGKSHQHFYKVFSILYSLLNLCSRFCLCPFHRMISIRHINEKSHGIHSIQFW